MNKIAVSLLAAALHWNDGRSITVSRECSKDLYFFNITGQSALD